MLLKLRNTTTSKEYSYIVEDKKDSNMFYHFIFNLDDMDEGEYEYTLFEENAPIVKGLLRYGDYKMENKVYNGQNKTYTQYMG